MRVLVRSGESAVECEPAFSFFRKALGIMFCGKRFKPLFFDFGFPARHSIHSLFCPRFTAVFVSEHGVVDEVVEVKPFSFVTPRKPCRFLVEAPLNSFKPGVGGRISWAVVE